MAAPYRPVSCALHSGYELAAMRRWPLLIDARLENGSLIRDLPCRAMDLETRREGEYLVVAAEDGAVLALRLDCLHCVRRRADGCRLDREGGER